MKAGVRRGLGDTGLTCGARGCVLLAATALVPLLFLAMVMLAVPEIDPLLHVTRVMASGNGDVIDISRPIRISNGPGIILESGHLTLAFDAGRSAPTTGMRGRRLLHRIGKARLVLTAPRIRVDIAASASRGAYLAGVHGLAGAHDFRDLHDLGGRSDMTVAITRVIAGMAFKSLTIHRGTVTVPRPTGKPEILDKLDAEIGPTAGGRGGVSGKGAFTYKGQRIGFSFTLGAGSGKGEASRRALVLNVAGDLMTVRLDGTLALVDGLQLSGTVALEVPDVRAASGWFGYPLPGRRGMRDLTARGDFTWHGGVFSFSDAEFAMDGNAAVGVLALNLTKVRPALDGTLAFQRFDLTHYFTDPPARGESEATAAAAVAVAAQSAPLASVIRGSYFGFPLMQRFDADLRMSANSIDAGALKSGRSAISLTLRSGRLLADIAEIEICGGVGEGQIDVDGTAPETGFAVRFNVAGSALSTCLVSLFGASPLEGRASVALDLTARGNTVGELVGTLNGKASLVLEKGGRMRLGVTPLLVEADREKLARWGLVGAGGAVFDFLHATFILRDGSAFSEAFRIEAGGHAITGDGSINLAARQIDMRLDLALAQASASALAGAGSDQSTGIVVHGPWAQPKIDLQRAGAQ